MNEAVSRQESVSPAPPGARVGAAAECDGSAEVERLRRENRGLRQLLCQRAQALIQARQQLNSLEQMKRDFIALISHELRTPITSVAGLADLIRNGLFDSEAELKDHAGDMFDAAMRLSRFVDEVVLFLQWTSGTVSVRAVPMDLDTAVAPALARAREQYASKQVVCATEIPAGTQVMGDAAAIEACMSRLLDNAFKFSPAGGRVEIAARSTRDAGSPRPQVIVAVRDNGAGIPSGSRESLYKVLTLCHPTQNHTQGRGLGLSIAQAIAHAHGGSLEIRSAGSGQGCDALLTLPAAPAR